MAGQMPPGVGVAAEDYSASGQAGGFTGSVFGPLGGPGQQHGDGLPVLQDVPRNQWGISSGNPSGDGVAPKPDGVFGDLGGGVSSQLGAAIEAAPVGTDPGGQGGMR